MKKVLRRLFYVVVLMAAAAGMVILFMPGPVDVDTAPVVIGPMQVTVDEDGETRAHDRYVVSAPVLQPQGIYEIDRNRSIRRSALGFPI